MTGVEIAGMVLAENASFSSLVPTGQFDLWDLPQGTGLPSVVLTKVSRLEFQFLAAASQNLVTDRVQATVRANSAEERENISVAIRDAWRNSRPFVGGLANVSILLAGDGPDFRSADSAIYVGSTDCRVSYSEPA